MIFKIIFNNNTSLIQARSKITSYKELVDAVISCRPESNQNFVCEYKDSDGDLVRMNCEEDFQILLEELSDKRSVKIFVQDTDQSVLVEEVEVLVPLQEKHMEDTANETVTISEEVTEIQERPLPKNPKKLFEEISMDKEQTDVKEQEKEQEEEEDFKNLWEQKKEWWKKNCKGKKGWFKKHCQGKKQWFKEKFQRKFDESIQKAIPQIAVHVAQILRNSSAPIHSLAPLKDAEINTNKDEVVHKGFQCDGCGVSPIKGVCYKCSVCKDFDFCAKCEDSIPHPHPFLKLRTPAQRPHALIAVINEEGKTPFVPGRDIPQMMKKTMGMFKKDMSEEKMKACFKKGQKFFKKLMKNCGQKGGHCPMKNMMGCPMKNMMEFFKCCKPKQNEQEGEKTLSFDERIKEAMRQSLSDLDKDKEEELVDNEKPLVDNEKPKEDEINIEKSKEVLIEEDEDLQDLYEDEQPEKQHKEQPTEDNQTPEEDAEEEQMHELFKQGKQIFNQVLKNSKQNGQSPFQHVMNMMAQHGQNGGNNQNNPMKHMFDMMQMFQPQQGNQHQQSKPKQESFDDKIEKAIQKSLQDQQDQEMKEAIDLSLSQDIQEDNVETPKHEDSAKKVEDLDETKDIDNDSSEGVVILDEEPKEKVPKKTSIDVVDQNPVVLSNTNQLMEIFSVPQEKKVIVMEWVKSKDTQAINELLNMFMDEMMGKF